MKRILINWIIALFKRVSQWDYKIYAIVVTQFYQRIKKKKQFILETKEIRVKKGKRRYTLVVCETTEGKIKFNLGRHMTVETLNHLLNPT